MPQKPLTRQKMQAAVDLVAQHGSLTAAMRATGISRGTLQHQVAAAKLAGISSGIESPDSPAKLKDQIKRLEQALKVKERQATESEIVKGIIGTMGRKLDECVMPDWTISEKGKPSAPGVPTLFLSDFHWGEVVHPSQINGVNKYNVAIAHERLHDCVDAVVHLLRILSPKFDYPGIVVLLGGDMISGNIHEELQATNEINSMPAVLDLYGELRRTITQLADKFGHVFLACVTGNHGRDTHKVWGKDRHHTSFDWLLYQFLAKHFDGDKRVTFFVPDGPDAYFRIYGHRYLLTHGDQFRGGDGMIGALGPIIRGDHKKRSRNAQIDMEYDTMLIGHWHQDIFLRRLVVNGALKGYDEYAYANNFPYEPPSQQLWLTHPKRHITFRMPIQIDRVREAPKTSWVSVPA